MFQCALGRLMPHVLPGRPALDLHVFIDAGGQAGRHRVWGAVATVSQDGLAWIDRALAQLADEHPEAHAGVGEMKGGHLGLDVAVKTGAQLRRDAPGLLFWANWYPRSDLDAAQRVQRRMHEFLVSRQPAMHRLDTPRVEQAFRRAEDYWTKRLRKPVNRHKVVSMIAHLTWLTNRLKAWELGPYLRSARIVVDREDLPAPAEAGYFIKTFVAAMLQDAGMPAALTGTALAEEASEGTVRVSVDTDSRCVNGLQLVDVLLPAVQHRLADFGRPDDGPA